ncbi:MAG: hypothetical protein LUE87_00030 [Lachnospiraceae bacterium]|nr:hypothetical protein [Lachnospiraceae bacterium]
MCGPGSTDLQRQEKKQTFEIRQELTQLQEWDTEENQTLEERRRQEAERLITEQREMNQQLAARAAGNLPQAQAREAAPGNPVQEQAAAKKSYKQRREESRRTKEAKKGNIAADHISYNMVEQLKDLRAEHLNSMTEERNQIAFEAGVDRRVLGVFVQGYRKNKKGLPATEEDARKKREDDDFYEDYISKDLRRRKPHLDRFVNELINTEISPDMFSVEYMEKHTREMKNLTERLTYFSNVMEDPINKPYFDDMPRPQKDLFEAKRLMSASYSQMFISAARAKAVNVNENTYHTADLKSFWEDMVETPLQMDKARFNRDYEESQRREREIYDGVVDQEIEREIPVRLRRNEEVRSWAEASDNTAGLNINTYATQETYERLGALRSAIESNPGYYEAHKQMVDDLYQRVYRTVDVLGDRRLRALASDQLCDIYENAADTQEIKKRESALAKREAYAEEAERLAEQFTAGENAINFFLKGAPLSAAGRELIIRSGYSGELV